MKTPVLLITLFIAMSAWSIESIPNGGFENWDSRTYDYPSFYPYTSNSNILYDQAATFNVFKSTTAQHGQYAVRVVTNGQTEENGFGFFLNGNPDGDNPDSWRGGIPINEKPTGITGYYKYNVAAGDTALVIVNFRKAGKSIGSYFYPLYGIHNTYTKFDFNFTPALTQTPDTILMGFASSWAMAEISLPGSELFVDNVALKGVTAQPAQLNGDFESWSNFTIDIPHQWVSLNNNNYACSKTTDKHAGNFALELRTYIGQNDGSPQARPGVICNGKMNNNTGNFEGGIPYDRTKSIVSFYYKYAPTVPTDSAWVWLSIRRNGQNIWFQDSYLKASATYKQVKLPIYLFEFPTSEFVSDDVQDSIILFVQSNQMKDTLLIHAGSTLKIDDFEFLEGGSSYNEPAIVPNGSYELWNTRTYDYPEFYNFNSNSRSLWDNNSPISLTKTTDKQSGTYAVKLVTTAAVGEQNFGYVLNGNPNGGDPSSWVGGIPISEKPTGITGYYKYNVAAGDSALAIASFSKQGVNIGTYFFKLFGVHATYAPFDFTFDPPMTQVPDSMILGFASSLAIDDNMGVPGSELYIDNVALKGLSSQPTKLNGGFESWLSNTAESPQKWYLEDSYNNGYCKKVTSAQEGSFALELTSYMGESDNKPEPRPARISTGYYTENSQGYAGGSPFSNMVDTLTFYYKYNPANIHDSAEVSIQLKMNGASFWYNDVVLGASANYKYAELPIMVYHFFFQPDTIVISVQSSRWSDTWLPAVGSVLTIDNLKFKSESAPSSIEPIRSETKSKLYPNPTSGLFRVSLSNKEVEGVDIINMSGQKVISLNKKQIQPGMDIDLTGYPQGIYLVRIRDDKNVYTEKLLLK